MNMYMCIHTHVHADVCIWECMSVAMSLRVYAYTESRSELGFKQERFPTKYIIYKLISREMKSQA